MNIKDVEREYGKKIYEVIETNGGYIVILAGTHITKDGKDQFHKRTLKEVVTTLKYNVVREN